MSDAAGGFAGNIERFSGFADQYDKYRPQPPAVLADILTCLAQTTVPNLVVDLGCGTGLSTRYWAARSRQVIGIEPAADMRREAEKQTAAPHVTYKEGFSHQTGLADHCADIITCSQSLHWMEPRATFAEAARVLRRGGVFAAYDYDWPPVTGSWEAEAAYEECTRVMLVYEGQLAMEKPLKRWEKSQHLARMQSSGCFRFTKEMLLHHTEQGNGERLLGLMMSQGHVMTLMKAGFTEEKLGIDHFRETVARALGTTLQTWYFSSRLRFGIV